MTHALHNVVYARLEAIANAEKITRVELGHLSRELLTYVVDTHDIDIVNRLLVVLTPANTANAILFFDHFLPWEREDDADGNFQRFGKMTKGEKKQARSKERIADFLSDENNNIWTWAKDNVTTIRKKNFAMNIQKAIEKAIAGDEKSDTPPLTREELINAIFLGGVTLDDMLISIEERMKANEQALARENEEAPAAEQAAA